MATVIKINGSNKNSALHPKGLSVQWNSGGRSTATVSMFDAAGGAWRPEVGNEFVVEVDGEDVMVGSIDEVRTLWAGSSVLNYELLVVGAEMLLDKQVINAVCFGKNFFTTNAISDVLTFDSGSTPFENGYAIRLRSAGTLPAGLSANTTYYVINKDVAGTGKCQISATVGGSAVNFSDDGTGDHWAVWMAGSVIKNIIGIYGAFEGISLGTVRDGSPVESSSFEWATPLAIGDAMASLSDYVTFVNAAKEYNFVPRTEFTAPFDIAEPSTDVLFRGLALRETREEKGNRVYLRISMDAYADTITSITGDGAKRKFQLGTVIQHMVSITVDAAEQSIGVYGETGSQWYYTPGDRWVMQDSAATPITSSQSVFVTYRAFGFDAQMAEDTADQTAVAAQEPGTSGIYDVVKQDQGITSQAAGDAVVASLLARYKQLPKEFTYVTRTPGCLPGQLQTIDRSLFGINAAYLIDSVSATLDSDGLFRYVVKAISTTRLANFVDMFKAMLAGGGAGGGVAAGGAGGGGVSIVDPGNVEPL